MTPEDQRIAIHKALGWKDVSGMGKTVDYMWAPGHMAIAEAKWERDGVLALEIPNYLGDLNAIADAEKTLSADQKAWFVVNLALLCVDKIPSALTHKEWNTVCNATAAQRAEALLRTLNLWRE